MQGWGGSGDGAKSEGHPESARRATGLRPERRRLGVGGEAQSGGLQPLVPEETESSRKTPGLTQTVNTASSPMTEFYYSRYSDHWRIYGENHLPLMIKFP